MVWDKEGYYPILFSVYIDELIIRLIVVHFMVVNSGIFQ